MRIDASSPKGWEMTTWALSQPFGLEFIFARVPRALPWAEKSQPFGLKTVWEP
jgi:hypothetical protein